MLSTATTVVVALLGVHVIAKFSFFALPYRRRRAALDKSYGDKPSATTTSDFVVLIFTVALSALLLWRGWITFRGNRMPPRWLLLPIAALAMAGVYWNYKTFFGREVGVGGPQLVAVRHQVHWTRMHDLHQQIWPQMAMLGILVVWSLVLIVR